jgi:hypothetical protein
MHALLTFHIIVSAKLIVLIDCYSLIKKRWDVRLVATRLHYISCRLAYCSHPEQS